MFNLILVRGNGHCGLTELTVQNRMRKRTDDGANDGLINNDTI